MYKAKIKKSATVAVDALYNVCYLQFLTFLQAFVFCVVFEVLVVRLFFLIAIIFSPPCIYSLFRTVVFIQSLTKYYKKEIYCLIL
jgi:hypothetical protein